MGFLKEQAVSWFRRLEITKKVIMVGKISDKDDILTVEEKLIYLIVKKTEIRLEMTTWRRE